MGAQSQMEELKKRLDDIKVFGEAEGKVTVTANANKKIEDITFNDELLNDKEQLQDLIVLATNRALENAHNVSESEMRHMAATLMPGLGGLFK